MTAVSLTRSMAWSTGSIPTSTSLSALNVARSSTVRTSSSWKVVSVTTAAAESLSLQQVPGHVTGWGLSGGTGTPDGSTAVVRLTASIRPPLTGGLMRAFGEAVTVTVESRARARVR